MAGSLYDLSLQKSRARGKTRSVFTLSRDDTSQTEALHASICGAKLDAGREQGDHSDRGHERAAGADPEKERRTWRGAAHPSDIPPGHFDYFAVSAAEDETFQSPPSNMP